MERPASRAAVAFIFVTLLLDSIALGIVVPVLPKLVLRFEGGNSAASIETALAEARQTHRRVLLNFGANWCTDSRAMYRLLTSDARISPLVDHHYVMVMVDVGERNGPQWDSEVVRRYGRPFEQRGIPALVVLEADGRQLTTPDNNPLSDTAHRRPKQVIQFLERWAP